MKKTLKYYTTCIILLMINDVILSSAGFASMGELRSHLYDTLVPYEYYPQQLREYIIKSNEQIYNERISDAKILENCCLWISDQFFNFYAYIYNENLEQR